MGERVHEKKPRRDRVFAGVTPFPRYMAASLLKHLSPITQGRIIADPLIYRLRPKTKEDAFTSNFSARQPIPRCLGQWRNEPIRYRLSDPFCADWVWFYTRETCQRANFPQPRRRADDVKPAAQRLRRFKGVVPELRNYPPNYWVLPVLRQRVVFFRTCKMFRERGTPVFDST
ncbi:hypothetical protein Rhsp01_34340 [Rhizobium sp. NBRC 114257]|uniref:Uncharacterized protein n=1 Tax=Rhizobium dioscoreae TaxID=2653122 RepID=A0ABQ0Z3Z3_9HYPH|nr:hypothetical protein RsS93_25960 [Rhizobium dioscoreae]GLU82258.1 hypothetical protein Rhsp01_34340 [Rhizobium sp. NBRC 114257]